MLEQQQSQLVSGLQEMYRRLREGQRWHGPLLSESTGHPLTHDILAALDLLEVKHDGSGEPEDFEEDPGKLQSKLFRAGAPCMRRKSSISSESDRSQHARNGSTTANTPTTLKSPIFRDSFTFNDSPSPAYQTPVIAPPQKRHTHPPIQQSTLQQSRSISDYPDSMPQNWNSMTDRRYPDASMRARIAMPVAPYQSSFDETPGLLNTEDWMEPEVTYDSSFNAYPSYPVQFSNQSMTQFDPNPAFQDFGASLESMDVEFNSWISTAG